MNQIPITNDPNQSFTTVLVSDTANISLDFTIWWNRIAGNWRMTIGQDGVELVTGIPMIPALGPYGDLLEQFTHLDIGHFFVAPISPTAPLTPGENDWGTNFALLWSP